MSEIVSLPVRCQGPHCGEHIRFVQTVGGRHIPVPAAEPEAYYVHLGDRGHSQVVVVTPQGIVVRGRRGESADSGVARILGWQTHFVSCPDAGIFDRQQAAKAEKEHR